MTAWVLIAASLASFATPAVQPDSEGPGTVRDAYGVPSIVAGSNASAMEQLGAAVAEDRLWQLEMSRRAARGRLAEVLGPSAVAADTEVLLQGYTSEELESQLAALPGEVRTSWNAYADGVNRTIRARIAAKSLPKEFTDAGYTPEPWTSIDSAAIAVRLAWMFGNGGSGELRNLAALLYLRSQRVKDRAIDAFDDLAWANEPTAPTTVAAEDDPLRASPIKFPRPTRAQTLAHLAALPPANLLELAPAVRLGERDASTRLAMNLNIPYKTGSYAAVVAPKRSRTGIPLLMGGPQMGHGSPSPVYEFAMRTPQVAFAGMCVPGIPAPIIGATPTLAWTLTSGVADVVDIFVNRREGDDYLQGKKRVPIQVVTHLLSVKGEAPRRVTQLRTRYGPIILNSRAGSAVYSQRRSYAGHEVQSYAAVWDLLRAKTVVDIDRVHGRIPITFNLFFAFSSGDIGYRYCGWVPHRAEGIDPRLPTPGDGVHDWNGMIDAAKMPRVTNPKSGLITNWNNKPVAWWDNGDTPVWGRLFRVSNLTAALAAPRLGITDLEQAAQRIARSDDETQLAFLPELVKALGPEAPLTAIERDAANLLRAWDGEMRDGSQGAILYQETWRALRRALFEPPLGTFLGTGTFETVVQPSLVLNALARRTRVDFLGKSTLTEAWRSAFRTAVGALQARAALSDPGEWRYLAGQIKYPNQPPVPYRNRGTYIQIVELRPFAVLRTVAGPGLAESGLHAEDQISLVRSWGFKTLRIRR